MYARTGMSTTQIADFNIRYAGPHLIVSDSAEPRLIKENVTLPRPLNAVGLYYRE
jgi:hypothetical protein